MLRQKIKYFLRWMAFSEFSVIAPTLRVESVVAHWNGHISRLVLEVIIYAIGGHY